MNQTNEIITIDGKEYELSETPAGFQHVYYPAQIVHQSEHAKFLYARPKPVEPMIWEGEASEYAHAIMPIEFAGKRVRVVEL